MYIIFILPFSVIGVLFISVYIAFCLDYPSFFFVVVVLSQRSLKGKNGRVTDLLIQEMRFRGRGNLLGNVSWCVAEQVEMKSPCFFITFVCLCVCV